MWTRLGVLALLDTADMDGDQLEAALRSWAGPDWSPDTAELAAMLDDLEHVGQVTISAGRIAATRAGRDALAEWFSTSPAEAPPPRHELVAKVVFALSGGAERTFEVITRQRTALTSALQAHRRSRRPQVHDIASARPTMSNESRHFRELTPVILDDAAVARAEAELRWLDICEARLRAFQQHFLRNGSGPPTAEPPGGRERDTKRERL